MVSSFASVIGGTDRCHSRLLLHERSAVDDLTAPLLHKIGQRGFYCVEAAAQVALNHLAPVLHGEILHRAIDVDASVIHQHVYTTELLYSLLNEHGGLHWI